MTNKTLYSEQKVQKINVYYELVMKQSQIRSKVTFDRGYSNRAKNKQISKKIANKTKN